MKTTSKPSWSSVRFLLCLSAAVVVTTTFAPGAFASDAASPADAAKTSDGDGDGGCQIVILNLQSKGLAESQQHVPALLADSMAAEIAASAKCRVITQADIAQMLDFEATKAACSDASDSCLAEVGGALGVDRVIGGSIGVLGSSYKLQIKLQNVREGRVEKRIDKMIRGEPELLDLAARNAAREMFDLPPLDESGTAVTSSTDGSGSGSSSSNNPDTSANEGTTAEEGSIVGTALLISGIVVGVVGALAIGGGLVAIGGVEFLALDPEARDSAFGDDHNPDDAVNSMVLGQVTGIAIAAVGTLIVVVGTGTLVGSLFVE